MRTRRLLAITATAMLILGAALPASADSKGSGTHASITVTGGDLSITVSSHSQSLGTVPSSLSSVQVRGPLGGVRVRDSASGAGWVASAVSSKFTSDLGSVIPASEIGYNPGRLSSTGTVTLRSSSPTDLSRVTPVVSATGITGVNSASWDPTITANLPAGVPAGTYSGTITHSVA